jgi:hypothetical protein
MSGKDKKKPAFNVAAFDQAMATLIKEAVPAWWGIYQASVAEGFSPEQAMLILITIIQDKGRKL